MFTPPRDAFRCPGPHDVPLQSGRAGRPTAAPRSPSFTEHPSRAVSTPSQSQQGVLKPQATPYSFPQQHEPSLVALHAIAASAGPAPSQQPSTTADSDMATGERPCLRSTRTIQSDLRSSPYGSLSLRSSPQTSPVDNGLQAEGSPPPHAPAGGTRADSSRRSRRSKQPSRASDDFDGAALVSGIDRRFSVSETPFLGGLVGTAEQDSIDSDAASSTSEDDSAPLSEPGVSENSPHEAVRASVPPTNDVSLSINTPRMWFLSILFSVLGSSTNLFFSLRYPSVAITPVIALLLVHPLGRLWDYALRHHHDSTEEFVDGVRTPSLMERDGVPLTAAERTRLASWRGWLAQGRWNEKEHTCVYVSSNVAFGFAFATDVIVEQTQFYNRQAPIAYQLLLTISTQILGYGFAGLTRRFLVRPSGMIWPGTLMSAAMFSTLHKQDNKPANGWTISRWNFFFIIWIISFIFYFLPGLLMPALGYFNVITWCAPDNVILGNLFGVISGLGLLPVTFDWAQIAYVGSPLLVPFWAAVNVISGLAVMMWIIAPILYYTNVLYSAYMPILSTAVFDNTGSAYNVSKILTPEYLFDRSAYKSYSRVFLPVAYMLSYGMQFAGLAALLTHTLCWHGREIWETLKMSWAEARADEKPAYQAVPGSTEDDSSDAVDDDGHTMPSRSNSNLDGLLTREDVHNRLMRRYKDVPLSWYLLICISMTAIGIFVVE